MSKIIERLFGSEEEVRELQQLHEELGIAIEDIKRLEEDWKEKARQINLPLLRKFITQL